MKIGLKTVVIAAAAVFLALCGTFGPVAAQTQTSADQGARAWDGHPDLNGIWQAMGTAHWDLLDHPARPGHPDDDGLPRSLRAALDVLDHEIQKLHEEAALAA